MASGNPACAARRSISRQATTPKLGTTGSTWKPDSCSVTEATAQTFSRLSGSFNAMNAAWMSSIHPARSAIPYGRARSIAARPSMGPGAGAFWDRSPAQPPMSAAQASTSPSTAERNARLPMVRSG